MVWPIFFLHSLWRVEMQLNLSGSGIPKKPPSLSFVSSWIIYTHNSPRAWALNDRAFVNP